MTGDIVLFCSLYLSMRTNKRNILFLFFSLLCVSHSINAEDIPKGGFTNLYKLNSNTFRSEQPDRKGFLLIQQLGIKTVINLRHHQTDKKLINNTDIILKHYPINAWRISYEDIVQVLKTIRDSEQPVLIHCKHGADRTGCIIAAYRMVYENVPKEDAIKELEEKQFGFHDGWYPNILDLLNSLDITQLKSALNVN